MPVKIPTNQIQDLQQVEAVVAGPDGANRLFTISGRIQSGVNAFSNSNNFVSQKEIFLILMGPVLLRRQFIRGSGTAAISSIQTNTQTAPANSSWTLSLVDVDWDDESGQVELRIEATVGSSGTNNSVQITGATFQVTVLAELAGS